MERVWILTFAWILTECLIPGAFAQGISGVTRKVIMSPAPGVFFKPSPSPGAVPNPTRAVIDRTAADPVKAADRRAEANRRSLQFQEKRALEGSPGAQYDLALRYLKGDGVARYEKTARHWLELSAKNGNRHAAIKLKTLTQPAPREAKDSEP